jgi:hypothetical protein
MNCRLKHARSDLLGGDTQHATRNTPRVPLPSAPGSRRFRSAFSLLEVMIAGGIFFMAIFAILALIANVLRNARSLRRAELDAGMVAAQVCNTNKLYEGSQSGDFGDLYPGYSWQAETYEAATNGLFQVDIVVHRRGVPQPVDSMSIFLFRPESPKRGL